MWTRNSLSYVSLSLVMLDIWLANLGRNNQHSQPRAGALQLTVKNCRIFASIRVHGSNAQQVRVLYYLFILDNCEGDFVL
jgi:hypothetical protein